MPILTLAVIEGVIFGALIIWLVPITPIKLALIVVLFGFIGWSIHSALSPLKTHHSLSATYLHLHFGMQLNIRLPRTAIAAIRLVHKHEVVQILGVRYDTRHRRLIAVMAPHGQVLLTLDPPQRLQVDVLRRCLVETILINVDQPDVLLVVLDPGANHPLPTDHSTVYSIGGTNDPTDQCLRTDMTRAAISTNQDLGKLALQVEGLTRRYHDMVAVDNLNLFIQPGEIYGFLGPNGAGKTTTIQMLVGLLYPHAGRVIMNGHDIWREPVASKATFGYVPDRAILYDRLTGQEFLHFLAQMRGITLSEAEPRIADLLALLDLEVHANQMCETYSFGMQRKLALAGALVHQPTVLILDEPLNGLDPRSARRLKDLFAALACQGITIFLSTHDLAMVEAICTRVGIIQRGRLVAEGSTAELRARAAAPDLEAVFLQLTSQQEEVAA